MRLRPELVLLQKTMVVVEGVARRIDPDHDIWAAAEPVVRTWIGRELSPAVTARQLASEARAAMTALANLANPERERLREPPPPARKERFDPWLAFALGAVTAAAAFALALWIR
jgi:ubiquinone biosynthesis protein